MTMMNSSSLKIIFLTLALVCVSSAGLAEETPPAEIEKVPEPPTVETPSAEIPAPTEHSPEPVQPPPAPAVPASKDLVTKAWEASSKGNFDIIDSLLAQMEQIYGEKIRAQKDSLKAFPVRGKEEDVREMNDYATILFIKSEALMNYGRKDDAIALFENTIKEYPWAQAWDPRGWYWSIAEKGRASIDVMLGRVVEEPEQIKGLKTLPKLAFPGSDKIVDYSKYGTFSAVGTKDYRYEIQDPVGLAKAVGEAIYPDTGSLIRKDPAYQKAKEAGRLEGNHWDFVHSEDLEAALYKWVLAPEPLGVKMFYIALIFEKAKMYEEALKAYHALVVNFPTTVAWTYWQTPWYPAQAAIAKIKHIARTHPELNVKTQWMKIEVTNGFDNDVSNDVIVTYPGKILSKTFVDQMMERFHWQQKTVKLGKVVKAVGSGRVQLLQYENGHWQMTVDGKPYVLKGMTYAPTKVGQSPDKGTLKSWMEEDTNHNGKPDGPYDAWVDKNFNNKQDADEPVVGDFQLMKDMGVNTIREYHQPFELNKELLRNMHKDYGLMVIMGDFLGKYTHGSGASWFEGTDYENPEHQKNMMASVRKMVMDHKDEPYLLLWVLGNENNYGVASNANKKPEAYFKFANEVAKMIKSLDPNHPVALCNGDTLFLDLFAKYAPDVDIFAANVYRGDYGFGNFWEAVFDATGKPAFITEYGSPSYVRYISKDDAETAQANYHRGNWGDIEANMAGRAEGVGNSLGGIAFEWMDEWWKNYEPFYHDKKSDAIGPFPGGYYYEEWFGLIGQGDGQSSPFLRQLKKSYFTYKEMWHSQ